MSYCKECASNGDYQYTVTAEPAPGNIVVPWWESELAQKDQRIRTLKEELDGMLSVNDNANRRIAELEAQITKTVTPKPIGKNALGFEMYQCGCDSTVWGGRKLLP